MQKQRVFFWTGGQPARPEEIAPRGEDLPVLPPPAPLGRAAHIEYRWGETKFDCWATHCSVRTMAWVDEELTWLHCRAMSVASIVPDETTRLMNVLIPAHYVTGIRPGPTFRLTRVPPSQPAMDVVDLGVFPPNQVTPLEHLPLEEIERVLAYLLAPECN